MTLPALCRTRRSYLRGLASATRLVWESLTLVIEGAGRVHHDRVRGSAAAGHRLAFLDVDLDDPAIGDVSRAPASWCWRVFTFTWSIWICAWSI